MTFNIHLTDEDYINYNLLYSLYSEQGKKNLFRGRMIAPVVSLCALAIMAITGENWATLLAEAAFLLVICLIWWFIYPNILKKMVRKNIMRMKMSGRLPYSEDETLEFLDEEIVGTTEREVKRFRYEDIEKIDIYSEYILIWIDTVRAWILPAASLKGRRGELLEFLKAKAGDKVKEI